MAAMTMGAVYLVRHARTALNADGRLRGHLDPPLDDVGQAEATALAEALTALRPVVIVSSPLRRAVQTATALGARLGYAVTIDERLIDRDYGPWAGHNEHDVIREFGSLDRAPGVEPATSVIERARAVLDGVIGQLEEGPVVLVAHDAVNRLLLATLAPELARAGALTQHLACWNVLARHGNGWRVECVDQEAA